MEWKPGVQLILNTREFGTTAWEWIHGIWREDFEDFPIRILIIRNWVYASEAYRVRVQRVLDHWSYLHPESTFKIREYRVHERDCWIIYDWPDCIDLAACLKTHATTPQAFIRHIMRETLAILTRWQQNPELHFRAHGYLMPSTIYLLPGARIRLSPPLRDPEDEEIFHTLWPFIPRDVYRYRRERYVHDQRSDIFSLGVMIYEAVSGGCPWWVDGEGYPIRSLREPLFCRAPWLPPGLIERIENLIDRTPVSYQAIAPDWPGDAMTLPPRWVEWPEMLERDRHAGVEFVYACYQRALNGGDPGVALFWGQLFEQRADPGMITPAFQRTLRELRTQLPVYRLKKRYDVPLKSKETVVPVAFEHRPALIFPFWHQRMEDAYVHGRLIEAIPDFLRLKTNHAPLKGPIAEWLGKVVERLYTPDRIPDEVGSLTEEPAEVTPPVRHRRLQTFLVRLLLITVVLGAGLTLIQHFTGRSMRPRSGDWMVASRPAEEGELAPDEKEGVAIVTVCNLKPDELGQLERQGQAAAAAQRWEAACDALIQVLACTSPQDPEYEMRYRATQAACEKVVKNPANP